MSDREEIRPLRRLLRPPEGGASPAPRLEEAKHVPLRRLEGGLPREAVTFAAGPPPRRWASSLVAAMLALSLGGSLVALTLVGVGSIPLPPPPRAPEPLISEVQGPPIQLAAPPLAGQPQRPRGEGAGETSPEETAAQPAVLIGRDEQDTGGATGGDGGGDGQGGAGGQGDQAGRGKGGDQSGGSGSAGGSSDSVEEDDDGDDGGGDGGDGGGDDDDGDDDGDDGDDGDDEADKVTGPAKAKKSKGAAKGVGGKALGHIKAKGQGHLKDTPGLGHDKHDAVGAVEEVAGGPGLG